MSFRSVICFFFAACAVPGFAVHEWLLDGVKHEDFASSHTREKVSTDVFWLGGVLTMLVGSTLVSVGLLLQKSAHMVEQAMNDASRNAEHRLRRPLGSMQRSVSSSKPYWKQARWVLGGAPMLLGLVLSWLGQSLATEMGGLCVNGWCIFFTLVACPVFPGEFVQNWTWVGAVLCVFGCGLATYGGNNIYTEDIGEHAMELFAQREKCFFLGVVLLFFVILATVSCRRNRVTTQLSSFEFSTMAAICTLITWSLSRNAGLILSSPHIAWSRDIGGLLFWLLSLSSLGGIAASIHLLNAGMCRGDAVVTVSAYMGVTMLGHPLIHLCVTIACKWFAGSKATPQAETLPGIFLMLIGVTVMSMAAPEGDAEGRSGHGSDESSGHKKTPPRASPFPDPHGDWKRKFDLQSNSRSTGTLSSSPKADNIGSGKSIPIRRPATAVQRLKKRVGSGQNFSSRSSNSSSRSSSSSGIGSDAEADETKSFSTGIQRHRSTGSLPYLGSLSAASKQIESL
eukprot:TRINITY_DN6408_c0_g1_i1.p1 TRINITY_DN6408_c0_g1~~TRINITY_DN6408_c0_g1_i1.p1  ORF type:complete len:510 (+),score=60.43 TRINITY_DN6408_c0_g1_i1:301-1830(+)